MGSDAKDVQFNPCVKCGACCAHFRVQFYWRDASDENNAGTPVELTSESNSFLRVMAGTDDRHSVRCVALRGKVGEHVGCSIYEKRPGPCRDFQTSFQEGVKSVKCEEARSKHGLSPLTRADWMHMELSK